MRSDLRLISTCFAALALVAGAGTALAGGAGELKFDQESVTVIEEAGVALITVERSSGEDGEVTVDYASAGGTATEGSDYAGVSGTLSWGHDDGGDRTIEVPILDDPDSEGPETIELTLSNPTGGAIIRPGRGTSVVVILASDGGTGGGGTGGGGGGTGGGTGGDGGNLKFDEESFEVLEEAGVATIRVERSNGEDGEVTVDYSATAGTATADGDFTEVSGTFTWVHNDGTDRFFEVPILDDPDSEGSETIQLTLSNPTGGAGIDPERGTAVLVILASDGGTGGGGGGGGGGGTDPDAGVLKFDERNFGAVEGAGQAVISVERSHGEDGAVTADYTASAGTATAGGDFEPVTGTLSWGPGDGSTRTFVVPLIDDETGEPAETVILALSNPTGGAGIDGVRGTAVLTVFDDDQGAPAPPGNPNERPGTLKFDQRSFQVLEGGDAVIGVDRSQGQAGEVSVDYTVIDGSATAGADYEAVSGTLTWGPGDGSVKTFVVPTFDDPDSEGNETVLLRLSNPTGGAGIDPTRGESTLTILDDDGSTLGCVPDGGTLCLAGGRFQVQVGFHTPQGDAGDGRVVPLDGGRSGLVWFFNPTNVEMLIKVIDACQSFGAYWVFFSATTNVDYTVTVTDTRTGVVKQYANPLGRAAEPVQDTFTFTCR